MDAWKTFTFEAAHSLPHMPEGHKCRELHGHSYSVRVTCRGEVDPRTGMVVDYADIANRWRDECLHLLDHKILNDTPGLAATTAECLARWIYYRMRPLPVVEVVVQETSTSGARYAP